MNKILTFYLNNELFGIDITLVKEINRNIEYTKVPGSKEHIVGLMNLRGHVVTLFDLVKYMGCEGYEVGTTCVILKTSANESNQVGFLIDSSGDVVDVSNEEFESSPANIRGIDGELLNGIVKMKDDILLIINPKKILKY